MRRWTRVLLLVVAAALLVASPVLASYTQYVPLSLVENGTTGYAMLPVISPVDNAYLQNNGFISSALYTSVVGSGSSLPWMLSAAKTNYVQPIVQSASYINQYILDNSAAASAMNIVLGYGGYLTTADAVGLRPAANFKFDVNGYFDASVNGNIIYKNGSYQLKTLSGVVSSNILGGTPSTVSMPITAGVRDVQTGADGTNHYVSVDGVTNIVSNGDFEIGNPPTGWAFSPGTPTTVLQLLDDNELQLSVDEGSNNVAGEYFDNLPISYITSVTLKLYASGGFPTGTGSVEVRNSVYSLIGTLGTIDVSTIANVPTDYTFNSTPVLITTAGPVVIDFSWGGSDPGDVISVMYKGTNVYSGGSATYVPNGGSWTAIATWDLYFSLSYESAAVRSNTQAKYDTYSAEIVSTAGNDYYWYDGAAVPNTVVTAGVWVYCSQVGRASLYLNDGVDDYVDYGLRNLTANAWEFMSYSHIMGSGATSTRMVCFVTVGTAVTTYFDGATAVLGPTANQTVYNARNPLAGASVPVNGNSWVYGSAVTPYFISITETVGVTEVLKYQPTAIVGDTSYSTGSVTGTSGTTTLIGNGTIWADTMTFDILLLSGNYYTVTKVINTTTLWVTPALLTSPSTTAYALYSAVLNNDATTSYYGLITWGTNPGNITVSASPMVSISSAPAAATTATVPPIVQGVTPAPGANTSNPSSNLPLYGLCVIASSMTGVPAIVFANIGAIIFLVALGVGCLVFRVGPLITGALMIGAYVLLYITLIADVWMVFMAVAFIFLSIMMPRQAQVL